MLKIVLELTFIKLSLELIPFTSSLSQTFMKVTLVTRAVIPNVLALAMWLSSLVLSDIEIAIDKLLSADTMLEELAELSLINAVLVPVDSLAMLPVQHPHALITMPLRRCPYPESILSPEPPLSFEDLPIIPAERALAMPLSIQKLTIVHSVYVPLRSRQLYTLTINSLEYLLATY